MKKIYKLTAVRIDKDSNFVLEEAYFTSKNKAVKSLEYLKKYLIYNHTLNANNIEHYLNYKEIQSFILDDTFNLSLITYNIKTSTLKYI